MLIQAKITNTRVKSWIDKKTKKTIKYLIVSVKAINGKKYAINSYGDDNVELLNNKKDCIVSLDVKNIKDLKTYSIATLSICRFIGLGKKNYVNDLNAKNIEILKNESKKLVYKTRPSNELVVSKSGKIKPPKKDSFASILGMAFLGLIF